MASKRGMLRFFPPVDLRQRQQSHPERRALSLRQHAGTLHPLRHSYRPRQQSERRLFLLYPRGGLHPPRQPSHPRGRGHIRGTQRSRAGGHLQLLAFRPGSGRAGNPAAVVASHHTRSTTAATHSTDDSDHRAGTTRRRRRRRGHERAGMCPVHQRSAAAGQDQAAAPAYRGTADQIPVNIGHIFPLLVIMIDLCGWY